MILGGVFNIVIALSQSDIENHIHKLQNDHFPLLQGLKIEVGTKVHEGHFFSTFVNAPWRHPKNRKYQILFSPKILADAPPSDALEAILIHELHHIEEYSQMSLASLIALVFRYEIWPDDKFIREFEQRADQRVLSLDRGAGLMAYRKWIFQRLAPNYVVRQRQIYMTPEFIWKNLGLDAREPKAISSSKDPH